MQHELPNANQLEVSIFGKSSFYGECILVHLGNHEWLIKDSFHVKYEGEKIPIAQKYLQELYGLEEWKKKIKYIVISHWHDDHLHGISKLVNQSENLRYLFVSEAMSFTNLLELSKIDYTNNGINSNTKEVHRISNWKNKGRNNNKFFSINSSSVESINSKSIKFISPTVSIVNKAREYIANQISLLQNKPGSAVVPQKENSASAGIKLECSITKESVLLGADIEDWSEIIERLKSNGSLLKSIIYKVAHHGSENGFDERVWTELLEADPISIITCWKGILPKIELAKRIQNLSKETYITANTFEELEEGKLQNLKTYGHVKCSYLDDEKKWDVQAYEAARNLSEILT